jgi:hypothetical protein
MNTPFNKYLYIGFILLGSYQAFFNKDYLQAAACFGIGLAVDPFNQMTSWYDRPTWHRVILYGHLKIFLGMLVLGGLNDK